MTVDKYINNLFPKKLLYVKYTVWKLKLMKQIASKCSALVAPVQCCQIYRNFMRFTEIPTNLTKYRIIAAIYRILIGSPEYLQKLSFPVTGSSKFMRGEGSGQSRRGRGVSVAACSLAAA